MLPQHSSDLQIPWLCTPNRSRDSRERASPQEGRTEGVFIGHPSNTTSERDLDGKDLQIIAALQIDGRTNYAELAKGIDLSQAAIRLRVNRLLESGVLEIVAVTDPLSIGFTVQAMIGLTVDGDIEALSEKIGALESAVYVVLTAGRFDLLVEVLCADNDHLLQVMSELRALEGVSSLEANTYLRLTKQTYAWGIPPPRRERL